jgi:ATP adenylyltransferase
LANQRLWAPWRLQYIKAARDQAGGQVSGSQEECIFCSEPKLGDDAKALIPYRGERCYVIMNAFPYNNGHLMVAPYEHTGQLEALDEETALELMTLTQRSLRALTRAYEPEGFNLGINLGRIAGAGFEDHLHMHVVPRWAGDTNFMPVIADTRVLPQALEESYAAVRDAFGALDRR